MQTLYIDIYFLINFTVDFLALYFATIFSKVPSSAIRQVFSAAFGGVAACIIIFIPQNIFLRFAATALCLFFIAIVAVKRTRCIRRIKFLLSFLLFNVIIGGIVYLGFLTLEKYVPEQETTEPRSRNLLLLSILILVCIGIIKLFLSLFKGVNSERIVKVRIVFFDRSVECEAFVDSGNLLCDPIDCTPVMILKRKVAAKIFSDGIPSFYTEAIPRNYRSRIRLIPFEKNCEKKLYVGIKPDSVCINNKGYWENIKVIIIIDEEEGSFGGSEALMPSSALENI